MNLNRKEIPICFLRMIEVSKEASKTFIRKHSLICGALLILCILYFFLSHIYHLLVYLSPFLACAAIFVRIFWSSEDGLFISLKKNDKKANQKQTGLTVAGHDNAFLLSLVSPFSLRSTVSLCGERGRETRESITIPSKWCGKRNLIDKKKERLKTPSLDPRG